MPIHNKARNPCLSCDWHRQGGCKNRPECEACDDRKAYVAALDAGVAFAGSMPIGKQPQRPGKYDVAPKPVGPGKRGGMCIYEGCGRPAGYDGYCIVCRRRIRLRTRRGVNPLGHSGQKPVLPELREEIAKRVLDLGERQVAVSKEYGIHQATVCNIVKEYRQVREAAHG
jgi:hypothetical protein